MVIKMKWKIPCVISILYIQLFIFCLLACVQTDKVDFNTDIVFIEPDTLELFLYYHDIPKQKQHIAKNIKEINFQLINLNSFDKSFINPPNGHDPIKIEYHKEYVYIIFKEVENFPNKILLRSNGIKTLYLILDCFDLSNIKINGIE